MGRITTPTYRVEFECIGFTMTPAAWRTRECGRPTAENLARHLAVLNESMQPGGCNHYPNMPGRVRAGRIVHQRTESVVCTAEIPS